MRKLSRRSSRVKSLNQAQRALDDAIQLLAENITKRVMDEAQVIMRAKVCTSSSELNSNLRQDSTNSLDSAYETSLPRTPTDSFNNLTDQIAHQIVNEAIRKGESTNDLNILFKTDFFSATSNPNHSTLYVKYSGRGAQ